VHIALIFMIADKFKQLVNLDDFSLIASKYQSIRRSLMSSGGNPQQFEGAVRLLVKTHQRDNVANCIFVRIT